MLKHISNFTSLHHSIFFICRCCLIVGFFFPGENVHVCSGESQPKESSPIPHLPRVEKKLQCTVEGCDRTFVWPTHFKYHLKTHRYLDLLNLKFIRVPHVLYILIQHITDFSFKTIHFKFGESWSK